jgi:hypothetical protein
VLRALTGDGRLRRLPTELALVGAVLVVNLLVRWATLDDTSAAARNARDVLELEQRLGLDWERAVQDAALAVPWLATGSSWVYVWGYLPVLIGGLAWLYARHPASYSVLRNALLVSGAVGVAAYAWYPCAPPRLGPGYVDTVAADGSALDAVAHPAGLANEIAAMPSFHVGWLALVGVVVFWSSRSLLLRAACVAVPVAMSVAVVATGNHWVLDVVAGLLVAALGLVVATVGVPRLRRARGEHVRGAGGATSGSRPT